MQTWTNAYWDDGSLKWLGLATVAEGSEKAFELSVDKAEKMNSVAVEVTETPLSITIKNGKIGCKIPKKGSVLLDSLTINDKIIGNGGHAQVVGAAARAAGLAPGFLTKEMEDKGFKAPTGDVAFAACVFPRSPAGADGKSWRGVGPFRCD